MTCLVGGGGDDGKSRYYWQPGLDVHAEVAPVSVFGDAFDGTYCRVVCVQTESLQGHNVDFA